METSPETSTHEEPILKNDRITLVDNSKRATILIGVFVLIILMTLVLTTNNTSLINYTKSTMGGFGANQETETWMETKNFISGILWLVIYIASIIVFLNWFRRAYGNVYRMDSTKTDFLEVDAIKAWFTPIINFHRPFKIMREIWNKTQGYIKEYSSFYPIKNSHGAISLWTMMFIGTGIAGRLNEQVSVETQKDLIQYLQLDNLLNIGIAIEAGLVIYIVSNISKMEAKLAEEVIKNGGSVVSKPSEL